VAALGLACFYEVPDVVVTPAPDEGGTLDGAPPSDAGADAPVDAAPRALTEAARIQVCGNTEVGSIAATGDAVAVICGDEGIWDPATDRLPSGAVHVARGGGAFTLLSAILPNVALASVVLASGADLFVLDDVGIYRVGPTANGAASCSIGTPSAGAVAGGSVYFGTETGINSGFADGVYRTPLDGCFPCKAGCVPARLARTPRHLFGGVAVVGSTVYAYLCDDMFARVYAIASDGSTASTLFELFAADGAASSPCTGAAPPGIGAIGTSVYFGAANQVVMCGAACTTAWTEQGPVRALVSDGQTLYWAVGSALRSASPGHAPITAFSAPETISAVFAGNGQPNVYVGTQGGNLSTLR
jgi:hypothetical protein